MADPKQVAFESLNPGDRIKITQRIKVGLRIWETSVTGTVEKTERRRNGLHVNRSNDDKAFQDLILLRKDTQDETTVTLDEFTLIERA